MESDRRGGLSREKSSGPWAGPDRKSTTVGREGERQGWTVRRGRKRSCGRSTGDKVGAPEPRLDRGT